MPAGADGIQPGSGAREETGAAVIMEAGACVTPRPPVSRTGEVLDDGARRARMRDGGLFGGGVCGAGGVRVPFCTAVERRPLRVSGRV